MNKIVKLLSTLMVCVLCVTACGAGNAPVAMWEASPIGTSDGDTTGTAQGTEVAGNYSLAGYPRKTGNPYVIRGVTYYPLQSVYAA